MSKVLIVGAGGVGKVVAHKCVELGFSEVALASRRKFKCDAIQEAVAKKHPENPIKTYELDADAVAETSALLQTLKPDILLNVALPYQDLALMDACLESGVHYLDTANYEPRDKAKFEYSWQWAYQERFKKAGLMATLGCGFDPGVTNIFTAYGVKHFLDELHFLDIVDCNAGDHGKAFATNFNPEINIREITQRGKYFEDGAWKECDPLSIHQAIDYPDIGPRESYLLFHEELESLVKHFPTLKRARFWMTFSENYIKHLEVLENLGLTSIEPVVYEGKEIVPLSFLKALLPDPSSLAENYQGQTSIGCYLRGLKNGQEKTIYIYNNCSHQAAFEDCSSQGVSYTTGVPAALGAKLMAEGHWMQAGVFNVEQLCPDVFLERLPGLGLPWHVVENPKLPFA